MSRHNSDFMMEEEIFLGGKISAKFDIFATMARMSPDYAEMYLLMTKIPTWETEKDKNKVILEIIETLGMIDFIRTCSELTRLSMILGDTREQESNVKAIIDAAKARSNSST